MSRPLKEGNDYMHFRFYGASIGRFQKPDSNFDAPIANPQGWNLYSYVKGNPVNFNDPTGHMPDNPERPVKPARPYGMMGGLVMGVNGSVEDQTRQAIAAAETIVNTLIAKNGVAGRITVSAEFLNRLKTDNNFRYGFTMWLATPSGSTQWNRQVSDKNTIYTYDLGMPVDDIGRRYPNATGITTTPGDVQNEGPNVDYQHVNIRINYAFIYDKYGAWHDGPKKNWLLSLQFASTLGHESYHAEAVGSGKYTPIGALRIKASLDGGDVFLPQATPESYWKVQQYYKELTDVAGPDPQPEYR